jgi:hypothetical protein
MMSVERLVLIVCGLCAAAGAVAAAETPPDAEFLEYLGMWEETDEEWVLQEGLLAAEDEERSDSATEDKESPEKENES